MIDETASRVSTAPDAPSQLEQGASPRRGSGVLGRLMRVCLDVAGGVLALALIGGIVVLVAPSLLARFEQPALQAWCTVLAAVVIQGVPFLLLGMVVSAAVTTLVPDPVLARVLPANPVLAVPVAGAAGALLPGCECAWADARVVKVEVHGIAAPPGDSWVTVTGKWRPDAKPPTLDATGLDRIPQPKNPYRDTARP